MGVNHGEPGDFAAAGAAVRPGLEARADRRDRRASLRYRLNDLVAADVDAGANSWAAVARLSAGTSGEELQAVLGRDAVAEALSEPGAGRGDRLARGEQRADESLAGESDETALTGRSVV